MNRPGKQHLELKWTLGTKDVAEAKRRWPDALKKAQGIFEAARSGAKSLTDEQLHALAGVWYQQQLKRWAADPSERAAWVGWAETLDTKADRLGTPKSTLTRQVDAALPLKHETPREGIPKQDGRPVVPLATRTACHRDGE